MDQAEYNVLRRYLLTGNFPNDFTKNQRDCLRRKSNFLLKDGLLYHQDKKRAADCQVHDMFVYDKSNFFNAFMFIQRSLWFVDHCAHRPSFSQVITASQSSRSAIPMGLVGVTLEGTTHCLKYLRGTIG